MQEALAPLVDMLLIILTAGRPLTDGQPTALDALSTLATGEVDDAMFSNVMLSDMAYGATSTPPAYISEALSQISSTLTGRAAWRPWRR